MKKRVLAALLAGMMSLSLVAGCGSTQETGGEASSSAGTEAGSAAEAVLEEASAETAAESAPAAENEETLVIVTSDHETGGVTLLGGDIANGDIELNFSTGEHSGVMVPVYAWGPMAFMFAGIYENTDICAKLEYLLVHEK